MSEEERLDLVSTVKDEFDDDLKRLQGLLEDVDDEIRETGKGVESVKIKVETTGVARTMAELEAIEGKIDDIDEKLDVDLGDGFSPFDDGGNLQTPSASKTSGTVDIDAAHVDIDAADVSGGGSSGTAMTSGGQRDFALEVNEQQRDLFGIPAETIEEAMDQPDLFEGRRRPSLRQQIGGMWQDIKEFRFTIRRFHQLFVAMVPLMALLVGALPAAIVGVAALGTAAIGAAAALAGIGVLGAMGFALQERGQLSMEPIVERLSDISDAFVNAFGPLSQSFVPLFQQAVTDVRTMMGPLADASAILLEFRNAFGGFVSYVTGAIPSFTRDLLAFSHAAMPVVQGILEMVANTDFFAIMARQLRKMLPALIPVGQALANLLPVVMNLSRGFLDLIGALSTLVRFLVIPLNRFPILARLIGVAASALIALSFATTLGSLAMEGLVGTILTKLVPAVQSAIASMTGYTVSTAAAAAVTLTLLSILTFGAAVVIPALSNQFGLLGDNIASARKELERFGMASGQLDSQFGGTPATATGTGTNVYRDNSTTVIYAEDRDDAARQTYSSEYERKQHRDSVFGG